MPSLQVYYLQAGALRKVSKGTGRNLYYEKDNYLEPKILQSKLLYEILYHVLSNLI